MIQLSFQPAFDPFHAVYRLFRMWPILERGPLPRETIRILDFYLLFPFRIEGIRLTRPHLKYRKLSAEYAAKKPYGEQPEDRTVFARMEPIQIAALDTLSARSMIDPGHLLVGRVQATAIPLPQDVALRVDAANTRDANLIDFLKVLAFDYELSGTNGLKARSGLLEYRYDPV
jgi:hypothetical protein